MTNKPINIEDMQACFIELWQDGKPISIHHFDNFEDALAFTEDKHTYKVYDAHCVLDRSNNKMRGQE